MHLEEVGFAVLHDQLNSEFRVRTREGNLVPFVLARVTRGPDSARFEQFSALFEGPSAQPLPQATYPFDHPVLGSIELFVVPVAQDARVRTYEAVFSRPRPAPETDQEAARE